MDVHFFGGQNFSSFEGFQFFLGGALNCIVWLFFYNYFNGPFIFVLLEGSTEKLGGGSTLIFITFFAGPNYFFFFLRG